MIDYPVPLQFLADKIENLYKPIPTKDTRKFYLQFVHGIGDCCQLEIVLKHLKHYIPDCYIRVDMPKGTVSCIPSADHVAEIKMVGIFETDQPEEWEVMRVLDWWTPCRTYKGCPSTKVARCLIEVFDLQPIPELFEYNQRITHEEWELAEKYYSWLPDKPKFLLHYQGDSSPHKKNLSTELANQLCERAIDEGYVPILLDWGRQEHELVDQQKIHCPNEIFRKCRTTGLTAALIQLGDFGVFVDSGPGHILGATATNGVLVYMGHHPLHVYDLAPNVVHLVPENHAGMIRGEDDGYFDENYRYQTYQELDCDSVFRCSL